MALKRVFAQCCRQPTPHGPAFLIGVERVGFCHPQSLPGTVVLLHHGCRFKEDNELPWHTSPLFPNQDKWPADTSSSVGTKCQNSTQLLTWHVWGDGRKSCSLFRCRGPGKGSIKHHCFNFKDVIKGARRHWSNLGGAWMTTFLKNGPKAIDFCRYDSQNPEVS